MKNSFTKMFDSLWKNIDKLIIVHLVVVLIALIFAGVGLQNGSLLKLGIEFSGGTQITALVSSEQKDSLVTTLEKELNEEIIARQIDAQGESWITIETTSELNQKEISNLLLENNVSVSGLSVRSVGAAVSSSFLREAITAVLIAFAIMAVIIFIAFRTFIPSIAAISAVIVDVILTVVIMSILGISLTFGSLAALLMLIGYSVDTDVLMSARVIKRREDALKTRFEQSMKTGLTFSLASLSAFAVLIIVSSSSVLDQIATVVVIGLIIDIPSTWIQNMWMLKRFAERRDL